MQGKVSSTYEFITAYGDMVQVQSKYNLHCNNALDSICMYSCTPYKHIKRGAGEWWSLNYRYQVSLVHYNKKIQEQIILHMQSTTWSL